MIRGLGAEHPAAGGHQGFGGDATVILQLFSQKTRIFRYTLWSKFLLKTSFLNG